MIRIYFWKIPRRKVALATLRMAIDRVHLARDSRVQFWKLLGTGKGETFTPRDADPRRWGLIVVLKDSDQGTFEDSTTIASWRKLAGEEFSATLDPISVHGKWSGKNPFQSTQSLTHWDGQIAAITRARIKTRKSLIFWRSVPPVTSSLKSSPGLQSAIGIGEAPIGLQGTFSLWQDHASLYNFAYRGQAHREAIEATGRENWYSEELFARFAVTKISGQL
jgi:hypothetical protein